MAEDNGAVGSNGSNSVNNNYTPTTVNSDPSYSKDGILTGNWSLADQAIIKIVLNDSDKYSIKEIKEKIKTFKGGI